ncbi:MAG: helix-turn-helix transcriptional regulator [Pseudomonadota bacterium]
MDYPLKTLDQLRPILVGFRKQNRLTQAALAQSLGITQQSYAQLEANPASVSIERLFKVLRLLKVDLLLRDSSSLAATSTLTSPTMQLQQTQAEPIYHVTPKRQKASAKAAVKPARPDAVDTGTNKKELW